MSKINIQSQPKQRTQKIRGTLYVYEDHPYWDKVKQQTRHKRIYLGTLDAAGEFVPNQTFLSRQLRMATEQKTVPVPEASAKRCFYGGSYLLDEIGKATGVADDLAACFPEQHRQIIALAHYLVLEGESAMYRFPHWAKTHWNGLESELTSQKISKLFASVPEAAKLEFFRRQSARRLEKEYLAYDTTSISSYSELIDHVKYGYNKDLERLPQINLALVFGEKSMLPVYFRKLPGNIPDVKTVKKLLEDMDFLQIGKVKLVMDRGFYSADNINALYRNHYKFVVSTRCSTALAAKHINAAMDNICGYGNYCQEQQVYCVSATDQWTYEETVRGEVRTAQRRIYVHVYYNEERAAAEKATFNQTLAALETALRDGTASEEQLKAGMKYFTVSETPKRGRKVEPKVEAIREHMKRFGFFPLLSNDIKDGRTALAYYRNKDLIEKAFGNLKERLDMRRTAVFSSENLEGKLFVQFVALIYLSCIHKVMKDHQFYRNYSMQTLLDELDLIERFDYPARKWQCGEVTKKQADLYAAFGFAPPNML